MLETWPLGGIALAMFALFLAALEAGYLGQRWWLRRAAGRAEPGRSGPDFLLSAVLGLLALLLGFTFSLALSRYEARRDLVLHEANAIGTTWLRAQLLEEPHRAAMLGLLRQYADARLAWSEPSEARGGMGPTEALQGRLWTVVGAAIRADASTQLSRAVMDAMNESFDLAAARAAGRAAHIPQRVLQVLLLYALLTVAMLGAVLADGGRRHRVASTLLVVLLTLALFVILDLDRPRDGAIEVSQAPLEELRESMR